MDSNTSRDPPAWVSCVDRFIADSDVRCGVNSVCESRRARYSNGTAPAVLRGPLLEAIDRERARLMTADSLLVVNEAINGLDTAHLNHALSGGAARMRGRRARGSSISVD